MTDKPNVISLKAVPKDKPVEDKKFSLSKEAIQDLSELLEKASKETVYEVSEEVLEEHASEIFAEAENRLHAQKGIMVWLDSKRDK